MNGLETVAQISVQRIINLVPEGFLIAVFAWALLRVLRRQNSGTRFAVWFLALMTVALLPVLDIFRGTTLAAGFLFTKSHPAFTVPGHWAIVVFCVWVIGASVAIMRLMAGMWRLRQLRQSCVTLDRLELDPAVRRTLESLELELELESDQRGIQGRRSGKSNAVAIVKSERVRIPAAIGFWRPMIVLPAWALRELPPNDLNVILLHELAHLRRGDDWTNLIQKIIRALFFFHPAVWWIEKELSVEREMACDDAVLAETANPRGYASCLISLLEKNMAQSRWSMAHALVNRAREASMRLAQILDKNRPMATRVWRPAVSMTTAFAFLCLMALPYTPQFFAFDSGSVNNSNLAYSSASSRPSLRSSWRGPVVVPAALHTAGSLSGTRRLGNPVKTSFKTSVQPSFANSDRIVRAGTAAKRAASASASPAPLTAATATQADRVPGQLITASAAESESAPQFRTLVFIETTRYGNAAVWSVSIWQVTFTTVKSVRTARVPVANSI